MLDKQGRLTIEKQLLKRANINVGSKVNLWIDRLEKKVLIKSTDQEAGKSVYFIHESSIDNKGRLYIPKCIRVVFAECKLIPAEKDGNLYIITI